MFVGCFVGLGLYLFVVGYVDDCGGDVYFVVGE